MPNSNNNSWVRKVAPWAIGGATLVGIGTITAKKFNIPDRFFNDHGDVTAPWHYISDQELGMIGTHFSEKVIYPFRLEIDGRFLSEEEVRTYQLQKKYPLTKIDDHQIYLSLDQETGKKRAHFLYGDRFGERNSSGKSLYVSVTVPEHLFIKKYEVHNEDIPRAKKYAEDMIPALIRKLDFAATHEEPETARATNTEKETGYAR